MRESGAARDILVVEDDEAIATGLSLNLRLAGHRATIASDGDAALAALATTIFDLVLLDINLPRRNGLDVLGTLRAADNFVPVIVLSARDGEYDKVAALRLGADDYVTKPFALAELLAPVTADPETTVSRFGDVVVDAAQRSATRRGEPVKLTHLEFELLLFFVRHPAQVVARQHLLEMVWGQTAGTPRTIDNFVGQLRKRLEVDPERPRHFVTVRGSGYRFDP